MSRGPQHLSELFLTHAACAPNLLNLISQCHKKAPPYAVSDYRIAHRGELFKKRMECAIMVAIDNELDDEDSDL